MLPMITILAFILIFLLSNALFSALYAKRTEVQRRLSDISNTDKITKDEPVISFKEKLTNSISEILEKGFYRNSNAYRTEKLQKMLDNAGLSKTTTPIKYMSGLVMSAVLIFVGSLLLVYLLTFSAGKAIAVAGLALLIYLYLQRFMMLRRITWRKNRMIRDLPYTLDLILVSVEAGLSFDGAIAKVVSNIPGPISEEFAKTLKEIRMGINRKTAMKNMSARCGVKELSSLNTSIIQADELGVSLSNIIRIQAATLREERKQKAREKALKAPVKILLPLILFVFPTIFIVILGPSLIKIMEIFK